MEKMVFGELGKRFKFDYTTKWCMYKPESVLENEVHKILWDSVILKHPQIQAGRQDL